MDEKLVAALVGGASALTVALVNNWLGRRNQESLAVMKRDFDLELEQMKKGLERQGESLKLEFTRQIETLRGTIADRNSAANARRDYEYDALKRLYTDVEPLLFQLHEALDEAHNRVLSLCRSSRAGRLGESGTSWIRGDGYYLRSTMYKLALPVAYLRLIQPKITFVDISLDASIYMRYLLLKLYCLTFTDDFRFAAVEPKLAYDPNHDQWRQLRESDPAVYQRQGLVVGNVENVAASLVVEGRAKLFSEFEASFGGRTGEGSLDVLVFLFRGFSPVTRPVLARMLIAQGYLAKLVASTYEANTKPSDLPGRLEELLACRDLEQRFAWAETGETPAGAAQAREYLAPLVRQLSEALGKKPG
jgi:hypothetical protein